MTGMTTPEPVTDDWDAEYGEGGPNHEWFEQYMGDVERAGEEQP